MIKLQDFARECGVTERAIQKHLKTYAAELEGLYQRKGPNGTWLTDEACDIIRSKMKQQPVTVIETDERTAELEARIRTLETRIDEKEKLLALAQSQVSESQKLTAQLQEKVGKVEALEEGKKAMESQLAEQAAAIEEAKSIEAMLQQERDDAAELAARLQRENDEKQAELDRLRNRSIWQRLLNK